MAHPGSDERASRLILLWVAMLLPPTAWSLQMAARYAMQPWLCLHGGMAWSDAIAFVAVLLTLAGGVLAWRRDGQLRAAPPPHGSEQIQQRARFMAALGEWLCVLFLLVIIAQWLPDHLLSACPS